MKIFVPILGAAVVCYLYYRQKISKRVLVAGLLGLSGCLVLTVMDLRSGELEQIRSLNKNSRENALEEIPLEAETEDGTRHEVKLKIPEESADPKDVHVEQIGFATKRQERLVVVMVALKPLRQRKDVLFGDWEGVWLAVDHVLADFADHDLRGFVAGEITHLSVERDEARVAFFYQRIGDGVGGVI